MSDSLLRLIPNDPQYVPTATAQQVARDLLASYLAHADEVSVHETAAVEFIDQGGNFESVTCPDCGTPLNKSWWRDAMEAAFETCFVNLLVTLPCCQAVRSLNDLRYEMPAGFSRFVLQARNPDRELAASEVKTLEEILGCQLHCVGTILI